VLDDGVTTVGPVTGTLTDYTIPVEIDLGLNNTGDVSGIVYDMNGNPIPNVGIFVVSSGDVQDTYYENTGNDGSYDFPDIVAGTVTVTVVDSNFNPIGSATGVLPFGGNVVLNVTTNTVGALLVRPTLGKPKPAPAVASERTPEVRGPVAAGLPARAPGAPAARGEIVALLQTKPSPQLLAAQGALR
jgi:hypothetical protein